ncbi:hypothetical protein ACFQBQ_14825 [Granulicella cerasi]|uniref:Uncharacterized protein n=1 Tax=Granulicella cerasi TaxID=741063 RepID=A0ABW1ZCY4_9BACT|nr:hypothetical protein [Granulicella cerasi]
MDLNAVNFDNMTPSEFSNYLPELIASADGASLTDDPRLTNFLAANPDAAALVRDLEAIAAAAKSLFEPEAEVEPPDTLWSNIASKLGQPDPSEA